MDALFQEEFQNNSFWYEISQTNQSAFVSYSSSPRSLTGEENSCSSKLPKQTNMNKRMIEFMRRSCSEIQESDDPRCHRHMMSERLRRDREKKGYLALHSILPTGTKKDKNSIIRTAASFIEQLKKHKEAMERRNSELEMKLDAMRNEDAKSTKIRLEVDNPTCGIESMVEVLKCLKSLGSKTTSIRSNLSDQQLLTVLSVDNKVEDDQAESALRRTLTNVERRKHPMHFPQD